MNSSPLISIVSTLYYSESYIESFHQRISQSVRKITDDYEIILVNDGSPDDVLNTVLSLLSKDTHLKLINLSRNFGHYEAAMTGLEHAKAEWVFLIDVDLEEQPEWLNLFWQNMQNSPELDVIYGVQNQRKGGRFEKKTGQLFYQIFNHFSEIHIAENMVTARLMRKPYVEAVLAYQERSFFAPGIFHLAGFKQEALGVDKLSKGSTSYPLGKKIALMVRGMLAFSSRPLEYILYLGLTLICLSLSVTAVCFYQWFIGAGLSHLLGLLAMLSFFSGIILVCMGVVAMYLAKIYQEVKARPRTVIKKIYTHSSGS